MEVAIVAKAMSNLASDMRRYAEDWMRFPDLIKIDREEAITNVERSFESLLEGFHKVFDILKMEQDFNLKEDPIFYISIALRNAHHHRNNSLFEFFFRSVFMDKELNGCYFIFYGTPVTGHDLHMTHPVLLSDIRKRYDPALHSEFLDKRLKDKDLFKKVYTSLGFNNIDKFVRLAKLNDEQIYFDLAPVIVYSLVRLWRYVDAKGIKLEGFDAETYESCFIDEIDFNFEHLKARMFQVKRDNFMVTKEFNL